MDYVEIEKKWQERWQNDGQGSFDRSKKDNKYYVLEMFSYPSGYNLHVGHWYNFAPADTFARFKRMQGYNVFQPMGFDSFGLPAENHAIKTGIHPEDNTRKNIAVMEKQLKNMGAMYDWDSKVVTCDPNYYRWTQWLFLQFYKKGLAYQKEAPVNWCTSCNTVIANEQVEEGRCERCKSEVVRKNSVQWFFKITDYAEELLKALPDLDWPEKTKAMQKNWIGKSVGSEIIFDLATDDIYSGDKDCNRQDKNCNNNAAKINTDNKITVFTTRADTLPGVSYVVLAPEHPLVDKITTAAQKQAVSEYRISASKLSDVDRTSDKGEKTGVFTGAYCINPLNGKKIPVWIAAYCLATYGTGAVMGVAAHDTRDFDFATKYNLPIIRVVKPGKGIDSDCIAKAAGCGDSCGDRPVKPCTKNDLCKDNTCDDSLPFTDDGILVGSGIYDGLTSLQARESITKDLKNKGMAGFKTTYRLRDWSVSRQRYWGTPIPVVYCDKCGCVPLPEQQLPVLLPYNVNFTPDGQSPLGKNKEYMAAVCPVCGGSARRDPDTLDTFVCSSWYFLRYPDSKNTDKPFDSKLINAMLPVDKYIGGAEHACMHLLYSRFVVKALRDMGYLSFSEPFTSLVHQGMILGPDGEKMSKSNGNVINPDDYTMVYGSDIFRMYLMFGFSYLEGGPWNDGGIKAMAKFLDRTHRILLEALEGKNKPADNHGAADLMYTLNHAIKSVTADIEIFSFNTAIARLMELVNAMYKYNEKGAAGLLLFDAGSTLIRLIAPFAPHFAEEMNEIYGRKSSVFLEKYPVCDQSKLVRDQIEIAVQVNSKIRSRITVGTNLSNDEIAKIALNDEKTKEFLTGEVKKTIVVKDKLINFIV